MDGFEVSFELVIAVATAGVVVVAWNQQRVSKTNSETEQAALRAKERQDFALQLEKEHGVFEVERARMDERIKALESEAGKERDFRKDVYESMEKFGTRLGSIESWIKLRGDPD